MVLSPSQANMYVKSGVREPSHAIEGSATTFWGEGEAVYFYEKYKKTAVGVSSPGGASHAMATYPF